MIIQSILASVGGGTYTPPPPPPPPPPTYLSWTIEWWGKKLSPQSNLHPRVFSVGYDALASIGYSNESGGDFIWTHGTNAVGVITVGSIVNTWHHWAIVSDGTNLTFYKDGAQLAQAARTGGSIADSTTNFTLGSDGTSAWKGRIADFHIMKGVAKYTGPFTPGGRISTVEAGTVFLDACNPALATNSSAMSATLSNVADDPWNDGFNSFEFNGADTIITYPANARYALDVA